MDYNVYDDDVDDGGGGNPRYHDSTTVGYNNFA